MTKVAHVISGVTDEASGPSYSVTRLCAALIGQGEDVRLATLMREPILAPPAFLKAFPLGWGPRRLGRSPEMFRWLDGQVTTGAVELIHGHGIWMFPNIYPGRIARRRGVPLVVSPRGMLSGWAMQSGSALKRLYWPLLQRPALEAANAFHATAATECEDIRRMGFRQPVAIIPNGIDIPQLPVKQSGEFRTLLFLGRVHPVKGLDILLPAWRALQDRFPHWKLRIVGPDNRGYLTQMQQLATDLRIERIEFSGSLFGAKKWQAYGQADLFVLPTYSENFGMSVAEALAAGTPAIVSKGAPWGGLEPRDAGWWVDIGLDPLVACLEDALGRSAERLAEMGLCGRKWMEDDYSWTHVGQQMAATYRWILHGGAMPNWVVAE